MELFVDDSKVDSTALNQGTVEDALRRVQSDLCAPGDTVVAVRCNGEEIPGDTMAQTLRRPLSACERLEVFTGSKAALVTEAMGQALASLEQTDEECQRVAELLTEGKTVDAIQALGDCLGVWQQIHDAVAKSIQILELDLNTTMVKGQPLVQLITKPKEILLQIKNALVSQDHVLLADILQYEFSEVSQQWQEIADALQQHAEGLGG